MGDGLMHLKTIHFVGIILGEPYVAAEFVDGITRHYWLQNPPTWQPNHVYALGELVQPSVPNGYYYQAPLATNTPAWAPSTVYAVGDQVQPTVPNGFVYEVTDVTGDSPTSGADEPAWPTSDGAEVFEGTDSTTVPSAAVPPSGGTQPINPVTRDRYNLDTGKLL